MGAAEPGSDHRSLTADDTPTSPPGISPGFGLVNEPAPGSLRRLASPDRRRSARPELFAAPRTGQTRIAMQLATLLDELVRVAERLGLEVRREPLEPKLEGRDHGRGGLCVVRGRRVVLLDPRAPVPDRIAVIASVLAGLDVESVHMAPLVRSTIERGGVVAPPPAANEATGRVPPPVGSAWVRVGEAPAANDRGPRD